MMDFTGKIAGISKDWSTGKFNVTFSMNESAAINEIDKIKDCEKLRIKASKYREQRSLDANALMWACLGEIAASMTPPADKWDIYLNMLKRYGKYTYICVKPNVVEAVKMQWRECEEVGEININGQTAVQMLCYFGSSTYDTKEFSVLLDGITTEMKEMGLQPPLSQDMKRALEEWKRQIKKISNC